MVDERSGCEGRRLSFAGAHGGLRVWRRAAVFVAITMFAHACTFRVPLKYQPRTTEGYEDAATVVALRVKDQRPPDRGGSDPAEIGRMRGGFGNPFPVFATDSAAAVQSVQEASADALRRARVEIVGEPSSRILVVTVRQYWTDGYGVQIATIETDCELQDANGTVLWSGTVKGERTHYGVAALRRAFSTAGAATASFENALEEYVKNGSEVFASSEFQRHLF